MRTRLDDLLELAIHTSLDDQVKGGSPIAVDRAKIDDPWIVCVGGLNQRMGMPVHEFVGVVRDVPVNKLFVRDPTRLWYQRGVVGLGDDFDEVGRTLGALLDHLKAGRRVAAGSSAGGFAVMGWSLDLKLDEAIVFSPQSTIGPGAKLSKDRRWLKFVWKTWVRKEAVLDVARADRFSESCRTRVVYPRLVAQDRFQAERLRGLPGVMLDGRSSADHSVVREMRDTGELARMLRDALNGPRAPASGQAAGSGRSLLAQTQR